MRPLPDIHLTESQIKFIQWVYKTHLNKLSHNQKYIINIAYRDTLNLEYRGYSSNSEYQERLNEIRDIYLNTYLMLGNTNKTITTPSINNN